MAVSVSKAGPYYSSGAISFSSLRSTFKEVTSGAISASELIRETSTSLTTPIVPNCTENTNITTNESDWKVSDFRNSIKYYYVTLPSSDTVTNFDIDGQTWNSNLNKNIRKWMYINGTCGSNDTSSAAAIFNATAYNLTIDVSGEIYGAGGAGGTVAQAASGGDGGDALSVASSGGNNIVVNVGSSAKIYGGGGGGAKGFTGDNGSSATCVKTQTFQHGCQQGSNSCPGGWNQIAHWQHCCEYKRGCNKNHWYKKCQETTTTDTPSGGAGGDGGPGRGYNNYDPAASLAGVEGANGGGNSCPSGTSQQGGSDGGKGQTGADGGEWGENGGNKTKSSSTYYGGVSGYAINGSNYSVTGTIGPTTVKGDY